MVPIRKTYKILHKAFGPQGWWPIGGKYEPGDYSIPRNEAERFEICAGAILTQNTAWKNVEKALANLKKAGMLSARAVAEADLDALADIIKPSGYYNQKARKLQIFSRFYLTLNERVPTRDELLSLWGIGPETADSIMLYAYHVPVFVVDAYTHRLLGLMGQPRMKYSEVQELFHDSLPRDERVFREYHALIVEHAKQHKECKVCPLPKGKIYKKAKAR